jgi:hypothetical protein
VVEAEGRLEVSDTPIDKPRGPKVWADCHLEGDEVVIGLSGWRRSLSTRRPVRFPVTSVVRVTRDPMARAHVKIGFHQWRRHGGGLWRVGAYHGLDGWSLWSIGIGRNAVLFECRGAHFRYVVVEVADPDRTVQEVLSAKRRAAEHSVEEPREGSGQAGNRDAASS